MRTLNIGIAQFTSLLILSFTAVSPQTLAQAECAPPPENLVAWWPGEGNANDVVGGHNGVVQGSVSFTAGKVGQAFDFANIGNGWGIDGIVEIADAAEIDFTDGEFSIELWVKPDLCSVTLGDAIPYITKESPNQFDAITVGKNNTRPQMTTSTNGTTWDSVAGSGACIVDAWHHLVATHSMTNGARLYVNGNTPPTDLSPGAPQDTSDPWLFGHRRDVSSSGGLQPRFFAGLLDEISFYDGALTQSEVQALYVADTAGKCATAGAPVLTCLGFDSPIADRTVMVKKNRALPFKARLLDENNQDVNDLALVDGDGNPVPPIIQIEFTPQGGGDPVMLENSEVLSVGAGTDGNQFEFIDSQWQFNVKTKNLASGTYTVELLSSDESIYTIEEPTCRGTFMVD